GGRSWGGGGVWGRSWWRGGLLIRTRDRSGILGIFKYFLHPGFLAVGLAARRRGLGSFVGTLSEGRLRAGERMLSGKKQFESLEHEQACSRGDDQRHEAKAAPPAHAARTRARAAKTCAASAIA